MDNQGKLETLCTQDTRRRWTNQKHHTICVVHHYAQDADKKHSTICLGHHYGQDEDKKNHNTIFVGHHYGQDEDKKPQHNICRASLCTRRRQKPTTQCVLGTTMHKTKTKNHNTIFVGHHYAQEEDKNPQRNICWAPLCTRRRQKTTIQYVLETTMHKTKTKNHNTISVGHHYAQDED